MIAKLANRIAAFWESRNLMKPEEKEIYVYGLDITISSIWITLLVMGLSLVFGDILYMLFFFACTMPLRGYCGGFHAKTHWGCALMQCVAFSVTAAASVYLGYLVGAIPYPAILVVFVCLLIVVGTFAPVEHPDNPIDADKRKKLKRNGLIAILLILVIVMGLSYIELTIYANIMAVATIIAIASMLLARYSGLSKNNVTE